MKLTKDELRGQMRQRRQNVTAIEYAHAENAIVAILLPLLAKVSSLAVYHGAYRELSLSKLIEYCLKNNYQLSMPIAKKSSRIMQFEELHDAIKRPVFVADDYQPVSVVECYNLELILLPLIAVDKFGYRLGQGGGYYDKTLANCNPDTILCGIGYDWQLVDEVVHDDWDLRLDYFASEQRVVKFD